MISSRRRNNRRIPESRSRAVSGLEKAIALMAGSLEGYNLLVLPTHDFIVGNFHGIERDGMEALLVGISSIGGYAIVRAANYIGDHNLISRSISTAAHAADRALQGAYKIAANRHPNEPVDKTRRLLLRAGGLVIIGAATRGLIPLAGTQASGNYASAAEFPAQISKASEPQNLQSPKATPYPTEEPQLKIPEAKSTPEPTRTPQPVQASTETPSHKIISITPEELGFLERLVFSEMPVYDTERRADGKTVDEYNAGYRAAAENIANIIVNRKEHPKFRIAAESRNLFHAMLPYGEFSGVYLAKNKEFFFNTNTPGTERLIEMATRKQRELWIKGIQQLITYAKKSQVTAGELESLTLPKDQKSLNRARIKLALIRGGIVNYLSGASTQRPYFGPEVVFYKNSKVARNVKWDGECEGTSLLKMVGEDSEALKLEDRHQFYEIVRECSPKKQ